MKSVNPVLLIEDDLIDQKSVERAFKYLAVENPIVKCDNGLEALSFLEDIKNPMPCMMLVDVNMPKMNGIEFLRTVKANPRLMVIPAIILTTSDDEKNVLESYRLGASGYMVKPVDHEKFLHVINTIHIYWKMSLSPADVVKHPRKKSKSADNQTAV